MIGEGVEVGQLGGRDQVIASEGQGVRRYRQARWNEVEGSQGESGESENEGEAAKGESEARVMAGPPGGRLEN
jgi:hypothetical protein